MSVNINIDDEWENFISSGYNDASSDEEDLNEILQNNNNEFVSANLLNDFDLDAPKSSDIYISTKTKIAYLNTPMDLKELFWNIPVISYSTPLDGVIKKQLKFNSLTQEELCFNQ